MKRLTFRLLPVADLEVTGNVRRTYRGIGELAESIRELGLQQPIVVRLDGERFAIVAGHRRLKAIRKLNEEATKRGEDLPFARVPCMLTRSTDEAEILSAQIAENSARFELRPWEAGEGLLRLQKLGLSAVDIAARVGRSKVWVHAMVRYSRHLHPDVKVKLGQLPAAAVTTRMLDRLQRLVKTDDKGRKRPDKTAQLKWLQQHSAAPRNQKPLNHTSMKRKVGRLRVDLLPRLKGQTRSTLEAVLAFLDGSGTFEEITT